MTVSFENYYHKLSYFPIHVSQFHDVFFLSIRKQNYQLGKNWKLSPETIKMNLFSRLLVTKRRTIVEIVIEVLSQNQLTAPSICCSRIHSERQVSYLKRRRPQSNGYPLYSPNLAPCDMYLNSSVCRLIQLVFLLKPEAPSAPIELQLKFSVCRLVQIALNPMTTAWIALHPSQLKVIL